jgi:hypothetical protein
MHVAVFFNIRSAMNTIWLLENEYNVIDLKMNTMWFGFIYEFYYVFMKW